jgi:hypothetical protein
VDLCRYGRYYCTQIARDPDHRIHSVMLDDYYFWIRAIRWLNSAHRTLPSRAPLTSCACRMCSVNGEPVVLEVEYCSSESEAHPVSHLLESDATHWRASSAVATIHLSLNPPSAISAVVISNAGCAELGCVAMGRGSTAGSYLGGAAPRQDFRAIGDAVQLLPPFTLSSPTGMTVFRVGRGEGRLSTVATTQPWTHLVLELRGLPPHCPGIGHVQVLPHVGIKVAWPSASWLSGGCLQRQSMPQLDPEPRPASANQQPLGPRQPATCGASSASLGPLRRGRATAVAA